VTFREKVETAFSGRVIPSQVVSADAYRQFDSDVEETVWFTGRNWRDITWQDWRTRYVAITFFNPEAFAYYLQSLLRLTAQNPNENLLSAESVILQLDRSPSTEGWDDYFRARYTVLSSQELDCLEEWLVILCESAAYRGYGSAHGGPGDRLGRCLDTLTLVRNELGSHPTPAEA
jgi:hypothetical protein